MSSRSILNLCGGGVKETKLPLYAAWHRFLLQYSPRDMVLLCPPEGGSCPGSDCRTASDRSNRLDYNSLDRPRWHRG